MFLLSIFWTFSKSSINFNVSVMRSTNCALLLLITHSIKICIMAQILSNIDISYGYYRSPDSGRNGLSLIPCHAQLLPWSSLGIAWSQIHRDDSSKCQSIMLPWKFLTQEILTAHLHDHHTHPKLNWNINFNTIPLDILRYQMLLLLLLSHFSHVWLCRTP